MTKPIMLSVNIPFEGFYNSRYSDIVDTEENQWIEYRCDTRNGEKDEDYEAAHPKELRLSASEYVDLLMGVSSYGDAYRAIAADYCDAFDRLASGELNLALGLKFEAMTSPREYNFETDRLFADIPLKTVRALFTMSKADNHETLASVIRDRFTSRSGFVSHYDNNLADWIAKPVRDWDHNELGTLLLACLAIKSVEQDDIGWSVYYAVSEDSYGYWEECVDWTKFEELRAEARADKLAELADENPERWRELGGAGDQLETVHFLDPLTLDMFNEQGGPRALL